MTRVDFFFNVEHKLQKLVELSDKATRKGRKLVVFTPNLAVSEEVERQLWSAEPNSFIANCIAPSSLASQTPVLIVSGEQGVLHHDVLINLSDEHPPFFSRFTRLIEIVSMDEADKAKARLRYRFYKDRGYEIKNYDALGAAL